VQDIVQNAGEVPQRKCSDSVCGGVQHDKAWMYSSGMSLVVLLIL
jgi:hypothetical protein